MQNIQFDPKIATDLKFDGRRPASGETADLFANLLKQRFETDQREAVRRHRDELADRLSGRPPRLVIAHARTVRGEAKEADPDDRCLPRKADCGGEAQTEATEQATAADETAVTTDAAAEDDTSGLPADGTDAATEHPAQASGQSDGAGPETPIVVPTQASSEPAASGEGTIPDVAAAPIEPALGEDGQILSPEQGEQAADPSAEESQAESGLATEQRAVAAMAEVGMVEVAAALTTGAVKLAPTETPAPAPAAAEPTMSLAAPTGHDQSNLQIFQIPAPFGEDTAALTPAAHARADHSSMDVKLRPGATPQGRPAADASNAANPAPSTPPPQASLAQGAAVGEFGATDDPFEQPFSTDGSGPGWNLHLAQGAANRRADFVAQLRQHLQNLPAHEQVAVHIQRAVREGTGKLSVQLSPAELGRIHVKLEIDEDKRVTAAVTVERPSTLELLQRDVRGLERALHDAGLTMEGGDLSFSLGRGSDQEFAQDLSQSGASAGNGLASGAEAEVDQPMKPAAQVMDTAAGVVNLQV